MLSAMAAFGAVMLVIVIGINAVNYAQTRSVQDDLIRNLLEYEQRALTEPKKPRPPIGEMPGRGPEDEFTTRFFTVHCDLSGEVKGISRDHISSVDEETAKAYTEKILLKGKEKGYYGEYRYRVKTDASGITVLFLNVAKDMQFMRTLLLVSLVIGVCSFLVVFVLIFVFSGYAVRPYIKNIERQKRFITDAGHELKTPITSIATSADIAAMEHEGDEWIANIQKQSARLSKLVGNLVALSRLDEEMPFPEKDTFSLSDAAWESAEPFAVIAKAEGKKYRQNIEESLALYGERNAVQQMLSILLDNAVKYTPKNGSIHISVHVGEMYTEIRIQDTGKGIDPAHINDIFKRFYREKSVSQEEGLGLGLYLARYIITLQKGYIAVRSVPGEGSCFSVCLPNRI